MSQPAGTQLGNFELVRKLGEGGMGEVYLAHDRQLNRSVAVKLLRPELTAATHRLARFEQEARAASALSHPNICHIYQLGETPDHRRYIAMEYVEGETLAQWLDLTRPTLRETLDVAVQIASAVSAAHAAGIIHRDLKPENVMLRRDRLVKVLDFGLAKLAPEAVAAGPQASTQSLPITETGTVVGTTDYMSPEQARGLTVDQRTDIWALGVVLYEMAAGRAPFSGTSRSDVLVAILDREPAPLASFNPQVPPELQRIVAKALRKNPEQRYQGVKDLLLDLEALRDEVASHDKTRAAAEETDPPGMGRRHRRMLVMAVVATLLVVALSGAAWWWRATRPSAQPTSESGARNYPYTRITSGTGVQTDPAFSPDGKFIAYASDRAGNFDIWVQAVSGSSEPVQVTKSPAHDTQPAWSPDGTTLVFRSDRSGGGLFLVPAFGGAERQLTSSGSHPMWSPDGREILFLVGRVAVSRMLTMPAAYLGLHAVSLDGEPPHEIVGDFLRDGWWIWTAAHPDGRISALGRHRTRGRGFYTVSRDGRQVTASKIVPLGTVSREAPLGALPFRFLWNAAGTMLYVEAASKDTRSIWRVRIDPATLDWVSAERLTTPAGRDVAPALSHDGTRIAFSQQTEASRMVAFPPT